MLTTRAWQMVPSGGGRADSCARRGEWRRGERLSGRRRGERSRGTRRGERLCGERLRGERLRGERLGERLGDEAATRIAKADEAANKLLGKRQR